MSKSQKKNLIYWCHIFHAKDIFDINPNFWKYIGFTTDQNIEKFNFLIRMICIYNNNYDGCVGQVEHETIYSFRYL